MKVIAYDPFLSEEKADKMGVEKVELDDLLQARRFHHAARAAHRSDRNILSPKPRQDEEGRAHHQLRARRSGG
jgi:phosphoglycerate dehydrogenase-like enzyme